PRDFRHYAPPAADLGGATARVFLGTLADQQSPVPTYSPLLGAEIVLAPHARLSLPAEPAYDHAVLLAPPPPSTPATPFPRSAGPAPACSGPGSVTRRLVRPRSNSPTSAVSRRGCCCSAAPRSRRTSSCGGTSSGAATRRSWRSGRRGKPSLTSSAAWRATRGRRGGRPRRPCPTPGSSRAARGAAHAPRRALKEFVMPANSGSRIETRTAPWEPIGCAAAHNKDRSLFAIAKWPISVNPGLR